MHCLLILLKVKFVLYGQLKRPICAKKVVVAEFGSDKFSVLVGTNVAAQGLDINDVHLIIQV